MKGNQIEPIFIPQGEYLTKAQVAELRNVSIEAVQKWFQRGWLPSIFIPGMGYIVNVADLEKFEPPKPGRRSRGAIGL